MKIRDRDPQQQVWREEVEENIKISVLKKNPGLCRGRMVRTGFHTVAANNYYYYSNFLFGFYDIRIQYYTLQHDWYLKRLVF
jgi:hypothetical protein